MADTEFDVLVIGGGPGGYVAAIRAAQLKMKTALVEREHLGGICLNWGCIPTKALLRSAEVYRLMSEAEHFGLSASKVGFDLEKVVGRSRSVAGQLNKGVGHLLKKNKVAVFDGTAKLTGKGQVSVSGKTEATLKAKNIIVATGARARSFPGLEPDGDRVWTYKEAMTPPTMPKSLLVIGSGAIGIEFASFYLTLGAQVTMVEILPRILPVEDAEISEFVRKSMVKQGMDIRTDTKVAKLDRKKTGVTATLEGKAKSEQATFDRVIVAVGVQPNTENLGLAEAGVKLDKQGFIQVDPHCRTSAAGVFAIGDVAGAPCLAHKASHEGILCVETIAGLPDVHPIDANRIPGCTYCHPQVASIGLTEEQAKAAGHAVKVGRFPFIGNGKAIALGDPEGMVKTIFDDKTGELLGAHMVGAEVTELIQGYGTAMTLETTEAELMQAIFPHPTLSEMMHESVLDAFGRAIHF